MAWKLKRRRNRIVKGLGIVTVFSVAVLLFGYYWVWYVGSRRIYQEVNAIPAAGVGLVLGTARYVAEGVENLYFRYRIEAAYDLYRQGKVKKLLLSGDNRYHEYNEPQEMRKALRAKGIPDSALVLDYAGFRTFDSVIRASKVFKLKSFIIISQRFHLVRALFVASAHHIEAAGFIAQDPEDKQTQLRQEFREVFARMATILDCYVLGTQPHFLGTELPIE
jgi:SanA protein